MPGSLRVGIPLARLAVALAGVALLFAAGTLVHATDAQRGQNPVSSTDTSPPQTQPESFAPIVDSSGMQLLAPVVDGRTFLEMRNGVNPVEIESILSPEAERLSSAEIEQREQEPLRPKVLRPPSDNPLLSPDLYNVGDVEGEPFFRWFNGFPLGFTGRSGVLPTETQTDAHFVPIEDRWRLGFPDWDRYDQDFPLGVDYPYKKGSRWNPYTQNVLKGDYPVVGQHTFLNITLENLMLFDGRQVPTPTTPFESTGDPNQEEFFGDPDQFLFVNEILLSFELFHGDAGFKPPDWLVRLTPVFNVNDLQVDELAIVNPDVREGTRRSRTFFSLEEWFLETKLADIGPNYDFVSVRAGSQPFVSDFRGFIFKDINRGVRLFGTRHSNQEQFNAIWFDQTEKDTNSLLNTFDDRHQNTVILNYFRQDTLWPGYTSQLSFHYNRDKPSQHFDKNDFLARPDPAGVFAPHEITSYYIGWAGDGHIDRVNINHAFYWVLGRDSLNPIAADRQDINAQMAAVELSFDRDWARFRASFFWASGDDNPNDQQARGFDAIFDEPNFAGGEFSFWQRQAIQLFGVRLVDEFSLVPRLRSSKKQGQTNFVNPGLLLFNVGGDMDVTPKLTLISNLNFLWFEDTEVLELFTFSSEIDEQIGYDLSLGLEYRPFLNDNLEFIAGVSGLYPEAGFKDLYNPLVGDVNNLFAGFVEMIAIF